MTKTLTKILVYKRLQQIDLIYDDSSVDMVDIQGSFGELVDIIVIGDKR